MILVVEKEGETGEVSCFFTPKLLHGFTIHYQVIISLYYLVK